MKDTDIVGKEFSIFKYDRFKSISWESEHDKYIGSTGLVKNLHHKWPVYALVRIVKENGKVIEKHFPTHLIREQLEQEENTSIEDIVITMKKLISRI